MPEESHEYEQLRAQISSLARPVEGDARKTLWIVDRVLGVATTAVGSIEVFLVGDRLASSSALVRRHLEFNQWEIAEAGILLEANRVALPAETHFVSLAAVICVELIRVGLRKIEDLPRAFAQVEPLVELALRRTALAEEHILGLVGELLCLEVMLDSTQDRELYSSILDMWRGHTADRDFVIGDSGVEVKTTGLLTSSHKFSGLHQIEPSPTSSAQEFTVFLLSMGLTVSGSEGQSLRELVDRILKKLDPTLAIDSATWSPLQKRFIANVAAYGSSSGVGYEHRSMANERIYNVRLQPTFTPRLYDLLDPGIKAIRRADLTTTHVSADDLQFRLDLPVWINSLNPTLNWAQSISQMVRTAISLE